MLWPPGQVIWSPKVPSCCAITQISTNRQRLNLAGGPWVWEIRLRNFRSSKWNIFSPVWPIRELKVFAHKLMQNKWCFYYQHLDMHSLCLVITISCVHSRELCPIIQAFPCICVVVLCVSRPVQHFQSPYVFSWNLSEALEDCYL